MLWDNYLMVVVITYVRSIMRALNEESWENEVADVHLNVPWAQQAEKKSLYPGCQKPTLF